ncbi:hypothetical protein, partial [Streptomyces zaomyceticus]|uniref:hypothetical protein n=1 Tax=Streptomyces zaomyceticus TaxID=68286 RepID=UPI0034236513
MPSWRTAGADPDARFLAAASLAPAVFAPASLAPAVFAAAAFLCRANSHRFTARTPVPRNPGSAQAERAMAAR